MEKKYYHITYLHLANAVAERVITRSAEMPFWAVSAEQEKDLGVENSILSIVECDRFGTPISKKFPSVNHGRGTSLAQSPTAQ